MRGVPSRLLHLLVLLTGSQGFGCFGGGERLRRLGALSARGASNGPNRRQGVNGSKSVDPPPADAGFSAAVADAGFSAAIAQNELEHEEAYGRGPMSLPQPLPTAATPFDLASFETFSFGRDGSGPGACAPPIPFGDDELGGVSIRPLVPPDECAAVIAEAEARGQWDPQSQFYYARDVVQQVSDLPKTNAWFSDRLQSTFFPMLQAVYPSAVPAGREAFLRVFDAKVLKYNESAGQSYLGLHRDGTLLTFIVALNRLDEYTGGGTYVEPLGRALRYERGHVCTHPGIVRHGGHRLASGVRYVIACFVDLAGYPEHDRMLANRADTLRIRGELDEAARYYRYSLAARTPGAPLKSELALVGLGQVLLAQGRWEEARETFEQALDVAPLNTKLWNNLGLVLAQLAKAGVGPEGGAVEAFERAAALSDHEHEPLNNMGLMLQATGDHEKAVAAFRRALDRADADTAGPAGDALMREDPGVAVARSDVASIFTNLGVSLCDLGELRPSLEAFEAALRYGGSEPGG